MPNFVFGQRARGNVFSLQDTHSGNAASRRRTPVSANPYGSSSCAPNSNAVPGGMGSGGGMSGSGGYQINRFNPAYDRLEEGSVIEDWIPRDLAGINKMFRIIYARDAICGPAVDIMSNLPWSEFDIQGIEDPAIRKFYEEAAQIFGDKAQEMPAMTTEFLVLGRFCASLLYSEDKGYWTDFVPHDSDFLTITPIPVRGFDPKLDLMLSPGNRQFINSLDYRDQAAVRQLPDHLIAQMRSGQPLPLDPLNTLYLHRKTSPTDFVGTSLLTRILPFWALEKALMNATVTAARRRASNILHLTIGLEDKWEPTQEEMEDVAGLFIQADEDPVGAVVATRTGVDASEIRDAGSLWKWSDEWSNFAEGKMRGLGISEALLAGDACVVAGTLIATEHGLIPIGEMRDKAEGQWQDLKMSVASRYGQAETAKWLHNGRKPTLKITSNLGHSIQCTFNHPLLVLDGHQTVWKRADQIVEGDKLCLPTKPMTRREPLRFKLPKPTDVKHGGQRKKLKAPSEMTEDLAFLLGLIVSEGAIIPKSSQVRFANTDLNLIERYQTLVAQLFEVGARQRNVFDPKKANAHPQTKGRIQSKLASYEAITCSKTLVEWLLYLGLVASKGRSGSKRKVIPWSILRADGASQLAFIAGFLEGDGSLSDRVTFLSSSEEMLSQFQVLLSSHGLISRKSSNRVELTGADSLLLWEQIKQHMVTKKLRVKARYKARNSFGFPIDPWVDLLKRRLIKRTNKGAVYVTDGGEAVTLKRVRTAFRSDQSFLYDKSDRGAYRDTIAGLQKISPSYHDALTELLDLRYVFTEVVSVAKGGEQDVFDLSMAKGYEPAFVANGICCHNTYNNMDQAKSTFVEQVKTMREALTQGTYYKLFKILARAHGFRKRKQSDLDHRVRTNPAEKPPEVDQPQVQIRNYEDVNLKNLGQDEALEIPEEDLIIPKVRWRKSLEPEGDREYLDILETIADKGVPIPLRVWAARGGYDLDEALEMLEDDAKLREKVVKWKDATAGEEDAWGAVDAPPEEPFWDVGQRFLQLQKDDVKSCVQELVNICHQPGKSEVLADTDFVQRVISRHVRGSDFKRELMNYVLMRMGVVGGLPLSDKTVTAIVEHYAKSGYTAERKANEFRFLARLTGDGSRVSTANVEKMAAASLRIISNKNSELGDQVRKSTTSPAVAPTAPTLLSGSTR